MPHHLHAVSLKKGEGADIPLALATRGTILTELSSGPWYIGSTTQIALKTKIESIGKPLKDWDVKINYGIKTGLNEAFIIDAATRDRLIQEDPQSAHIIKPILRGRDIKRYGYEWAGLYILYLHTGIDIQKYTAIFKHLLPHKEKLEARTGGGSIKNGAMVIPYKWYELQVDYYNSGTYLEFEKEKIVYGQFQGGSEFSFAPAGFYMSSNEYMISGEYSRRYFLGILNSKITKWFLDTQASSLGGNASIFQKGIFLELPIPPITPTNQHIVTQIEGLVDTILDKKKGDYTVDTSELERQIDRLVYTLYSLTQAEIDIDIVEGR